MPSNLSTVGFDIRTREAFAHLVHTAARSGIVVAGPLGRYVRWPDGPGEQLWVQIDGHGAVVGMNPHFAGSARLPVAAVSAVRDQEHPMDGYLWCWAAPVDDDPESGAYPFVVDIPDFDAATDDLVLPWFGAMQVAAFARTLASWPDEVAYEAAEAEKWAHRATEGEREVKGFAAESFIPTGTFTIGDPPPDATEGGRSTGVPTAEAWFTGRVLDTTLRTNGHTGRSFRHVLVRTLGGEYDVVADPEVVGGEPVAGGVVQGSFWLTGRLVLEGEPGSG